MFLILFLLFLYRCNCDCVGFMYVWVSVLFRYNINYNNSMIAWNRWAFQMCVFFLFASICYFYMLTAFFFWWFDISLLQLKMDVCTHESVCVKNEWLCVFVCARCFVFRPLDGGHPSFFILSRICDLWWRLMRMSRGCPQQQIISKLTASTGGDDVMNSTPSNEQWRKEEEGGEAAGVYS